MLKTLLWLSVGLAFGFAGGAGFVLYKYPFWFPPGVVDEDVDIGEVKALLADTSFRSDEYGQDDLHWGRGGVKVYFMESGEILMELQDDFVVGPGPDFWVYLNREAGVDDEDDFEEDDGRIRVAKLKSFEKSQVYALRVEDFENAEAVTIWCERFGQYIASADFYPR